MSDLQVPLIIEVNQLPILDCLLIDCQAEIPGSMTIRMNICHHVGQKALTSTILPLPMDPVYASDASSSSLKQPPSYHIDRLRDAPIGHYYNVITNGYGAMLNYAQQLEPRDRWAVIAYIRVLQYSENANVNDLPQEARSRVPPTSQPPIAAQANEPLVTRDADFTDFPAKPATPSGVPGAHGAGAVPGSQPERK